MANKNITKVVLSHAPGCSWKSVIDTENPNNKDFDKIMHDGFARTYDILTKAGKEIYVILDNPYHPYEKWFKCRESVVRRPVVIPDFLSSKNLNICYVKLADTEGKIEKNNWRKVSRAAAAGYTNIHFIDLELE